MQPSNVSRDESKFPNLLFISDVPVEASYHGSALIYRLLQNWPVDKLRVIEGTIHSSQVKRRLGGVRYSVLKFGWKRLLYTRFSQWYSVLLSQQAPSYANKIPPLVDEFQPQAIVTVTHGYLWLTAAAYAKKHNIPLHLICHDDWPRLGSLPNRFSAWLDRQFREVYQLATSRMCVSPAMRDAYRDRYGCDGTVVYPSRAVDAPVYETPPDRLVNQNNPFTVAFGGTINTQGYIRAILALASVLDNVKGKLMIFGPLNPDEAQSFGLVRHNIELMGLLPSDELLKRFRNEVDVLFVPMSFDEKDRPNMEISFPSKLTDYSVSGVPLLIYGPPYCSAVRWATENKGVAMVVNSENTELLTKAIQQLAASPSLRMQLGQASLNVGKRYFALQSVEAVFHQALLAD